MVMAHIVPELLPETEQPDLKPEWLPMQRSCVSKFLIAGEVDRNPVSGMGSNLLWIMELM